MTDKEIETIWLRVTGFDAAGDEADIIAARDWSAKKYGKPIGDDAAIGCWKAMFAANIDAEIAKESGE